MVSENALRTTHSENSIYHAILFQSVFYRISKLYMVANFPFPFPQQAGNMATTAQEGLAEIVYIYIYSVVFIVGLLLVQ